MLLLAQRAFELRGPVVPLLEHTPKSRTGYLGSLQSTWETNMLLCLLCLVKILLLNKVPSATSAKSNDSSHSDQGCTDGLRARTQFVIKRMPLRTGDAVNQSLGQF